MVQLESIKSVKISPITILRYTVAIEYWIKEHTKFTKNELHGNHQPYLKCLHRESGHIQLYAIDKLCIIVESSNSWCSSTVASPFWLIRIELNAVLCIVSECIVLPTVYYWVLIERETSYGNMGTVLKICNHIHSKKLECIIQVTRCPVILQYNNWILTILRQHYNIPIFS